MPTDLQPGELSRIVERCAAKVEENYVFPATGTRLAALLRERLASGAYHQVGDPRVLAELVTTDLRSVNGDPHLRLRHRPERIPLQKGTSARTDAVRAAELTMGGVPAVARLTGGAALMELGHTLLPARDAAEPVGAAFTLVARSEALLLDLRRCRGGDPHTVALICSYLLDDHTHLNTLRHRDDKRTVQFWTLPAVVGRPYGAARPLFLLIGPSTFSGAEELAYTLQQLGRGTVVGARSGGGAHPQITFPLHAHLEASVPYARAVNPVSGTNWEGVGVGPDVEVPAAEDAREVAHRLALEAVARRGGRSASVVEAREELSRRLDEETSAAKAAHKARKAAERSAEGAVRPATA